MNFKRLKILRVAARVIRCHTTPTIHLQSVGEHTFGALNILYTIHHCPSYQLIRALLWHDVPEAITGDIPGPAKTPALKSVLSDIEDQIEKDYELYPGDLTPMERQLLLYCDLMDLAMFSAEEADIGNIAAAVLMRRALAVIERHGAQGVTPAAEDLFYMMKDRVLSRYDMKRAESTINGWFHYDE
jgi:5'-deoxynucleotidase YfbR-like HD superfamily hydrolase